MKAGLTVKSEHLKSLHYLDQLEHQLDIKHYLINGADVVEKRTHETILPWNEVEQIISI